MIRKKLKSVRCTYNIKMKNWTQFLRILVVDLKKNNIILEVEKIFQFHHDLLV